MDKLYEFWHVWSCNDRHSQNMEQSHCRWILSHHGSPTILEWVAYPFSRGSSQPRNWSRVSCIAGGFFTNWAIREALQNSHITSQNILHTLPFKSIPHPTPTYGRHSSVLHCYSFVFSAAATAAKSLQSCPTLCDPIDGSPPGSPVPGILQARTLEWVAISFSNAWKWKMKGKLLSHVRLLALSLLDCNIKDWMPWSSFSECWALSQLFHSPLSLSSRGFLVPLHFLP